MLIEMDAVPIDVRAFRGEFQARWVGPRYRGWLHLATTTVGSLAAIALAAWQVRAPSAAELATIPAAFLFANLAEYLGHRGPMHHRRPGLGLLYQRHSLEHHRYFTHDAMQFESTRDFKMVLFPPVMLLFFLGGIAGPIGLACGALLGANVAWLFVATAVSYFLTYEWLHFAYHMPAASRVGRLAVVRVLRRHHQRHHDPRVMAHGNFNITFPITDWLLGTIRR